MMRRLAFIILVLLAVGLIVVTVFPYIETNRWFVRMADFPRLQFLLAIIVLIIALAFFLVRHPFGAGLLLVALLLAGIAHVVELWPYRPGGANFVDSCPDDARLAVLVANVRMGNRTAQPLIEMVRREKPDLFLALETDAWWDQALAPLADTMPHRIQEIGGSYFGLHLFARLPLVEPEIRYLAGQDVPAVVTGVRLGSGETISFIGLHPRPPHPTQPATGRDAQLYAAAFALVERNLPSVVAGDLNATPWESSTERMRRIGGLLDPRRGYGYVPTYSAQSLWQSWPLDQVFYGAGWATMSLKRLDAFDSDHYPYMTRLCRTRDAGQSPPAMREGDLEEARAAIAAAMGKDANGR